MITAFGRMLIAFVATLFVLFAPEATAVARAQQAIVTAAPPAKPGFPPPLPTAASPVDDARFFRTGHGWVVAVIEANEPPRASPNAPPTTDPASRPKPEVRLLHIPPREWNDLDPAPAFKQAAVLTEIPAGIAAWENRVWAAFTPEPVRGGVQNETGEATQGRRPAVQRRVFTWTAARNIAGAWEYFPIGSAEAAASLPGSSDLLGFAGSARGPLALLTDAAGSGSLRLEVLDGTQWRETTLPTAVMMANTGPVDTERWSFATLIDDDAGVLLIVQASGKKQLTGYSGRARPRTPDDGPSVIDWADQPAWEWTLPGSTQPANLRFVAIGGVTLAIERTSAQQALVHRVGLPPASTTLVAPSALPVTPEEAALGVVASHGADRVLLIASTPKPVPPATTANGPAPGANSRFHLTELDPSGRVYFDGTPRVRSLVSGQEFRYFALALGAVMVTVLFFVLRTDAQTLIALPDGIALATPTRRLLASVIDYIMPLAISSLLFGVNISEVIGPAAVMRFDRAWPPLLLSLLLAAIFGAFNEWIVGWTLGKRLAGCFVLANRGPAAPRNPAGTDKDEPATGPKVVGHIEIGRPTLAQALIRNLIKFGCPPLLFLIFIDANWRHAGDALASTLVCVEIPDEEEPDDFE